MPALTVPLSTFPIAIVPLSLYLSKTGILRSALASLPSMVRLSNKLSSVGMPVLFSLLSTLPDHQGQEPGSTTSFTFAPDKPLMGMNFTSFFTT